jgi:hypothetical protein
MLGDYVENILTPDDIGTEMDLTKFKGLLDLSNPILAGKILKLRHLQLKYFVGVI